MLTQKVIFWGQLCLLAAGLSLGSVEAHADGDLRKVNHVVVIMMENHSFDNYFGALPYASHGPYHRCKGRVEGDHRCVDGLTCTGSGSSLNCTNSNPDENGNPVSSFHDPRLCTGSDMDHGWVGSHFEANWMSPISTIVSTPNNGFILRNDVSFPDVQPTDHDTMGYYTGDDLPFYYGLAETFGIDDRYFCSLIGPTFPNRAYLIAATSFGHVSTSEDIPPIPAGYRPITGTIYDLLDKYGVSWIDYYSDVPTSIDARPFLSNNLAPITQFATDAAAGNLPQVAYVDPNFGFLVPADESDEHPPSDIRKGQYLISQIVAAVRNSPSWKDTVIFITYDEHGGTYDHVPPPRARQAGALNPDGISPGQCADLSNPPESELPGGGYNCAASQGAVAELCPDFTPTGPFPRDCPNFNQYGFRVPLIAVSPFSKRHYVSHTVGDHTSIDAFIEKRFMTTTTALPHPAMTLRDANALTLEDMFDFTRSPSLNSGVPAAPAPDPSDPGCTPD